ncbi:hypothetical protein CRE_30192 [Caenorhabditis remanei]|uniref:C-type lectin domain-containing protein n=1 Tax=Caenorhabditis remanei TaxID=31234 RepID=E3NGL4_CAERE|nr:hypothetical protein CRE_30192 [Caenorhabditis remanei]
MPKPTGGSQFHVTLEREASAKSENVEDSHRVELEEENYQHVMNPDDPDESYNHPIRFVRNPRLSREARGEPPEYELGRETELEEEEPVRFRQPRQEEEQEPANPPEEPPEDPQNTPFLDVAVNFILDYWKMISLGLLALLILGLVIFLIVFFVTLKPAGHATVAPNSTTSTVTGSTVTTVTKPTAVTIPTVSTTTTTTTVTQAPTTTTKTTTATTAVTSLPTTTTTLSPAPTPTADPNSICTDGYTLFYNKCLKVITQPATQASAYEICSKTGASLVVIKSGGENREIGEFLKLQGLRKIWIGLQCNENDKSSCLWDFGQGDLTSYSNFVTGSPNIGYGRCVFYLYNESLPDAGQWGNGNCDVDQLSYLCEVPPTINDYCDFNYNKHCYTRIDYGFTFTDAQDACQRICSNLISIHSELENRFVTSMFNITGYLMLGGVAPAKDLVMWIDGTPRDYNNLKLFIADQNCMYMNYITGDWSSVDCASAAWPVCKRKAGARC